MLDVLSCAQLYPVGRGWREDPANKSLSLWTIIRIVLSIVYYTCTRSEREDVVLSDGCCSSHEKNAAVVYGCS